MKKLFTMLALAVCLTGCQVASKESVTNLLQAPKLSQRESEIVAALNDYLGENILLKYPKQGSDISPVQMYDVNSDGVKEAVVFYTIPGQGGYVQMAIMTNTGTSWQVDYTAEGNGSEVYGTSLERITTGRILQLIIGYTFSDSSEKILTVYNIDNGRIVGQDIYSCQSYMVGDVTGDGRSDIVIAGVNADNQASVVQVFSTHYSQRIQLAASSELPATNARVTSIATSRNGYTDVPAIVVDYSDTNHLVHTVAMCFVPEGGMLKVQPIIGEEEAEPQPAEENNLQTILDADRVVKRWQGAYSLNSRDVNKDKFLETATVVDYEYCQRQGVTVMEWTNFLQPQPQRRFIGICHTANGVFFPFEEEWQDKIVILYSDEEQCWLVKSLIDDSEIMRFEFVTTRNPNDESNINIRYVSAGIQLIKFTFSREVSYQQKEFITGNLMYMK